MSKVHWIGAGNLRGWAQTACGVEATIISVGPKQYRTAAGKNIDAIYRSWEGVTCARCLRNPHSPSGRVTVALSSHVENSK
jgi:hypothetical protein